MKRDSLVFALSGTFFGVLVGWIIGSQQAQPATAAVAPQAVTDTAAPASAAPAAPPRLDTARIADLERQAAAEPTNADVRGDIGNAYFDGEKYDQAISWYEAALKLAPRNVNVSTDLGVAYYYTNQVDRALKQLDYSLSIDPKHLKSLLNQGIVRAWGKQDLAGAQQAWERVVTLAPTSDEGRKAQQGLDGIRSAHGQTGPAQ